MGLFDTPRSSSKQEKAGEAYIAIFQACCQIIWTGIPHLQRFMRSLRKLQPTSKPCRQEHLPTSYWAVSTFAFGRDGKLAAVDSLRHHEEDPAHRKEEQPRSARVESCSLSQTAEQNTPCLQSHTNVKRAWQAQLSEREAATRSAGHSPFKKQLVWHPSEEKSSPQSTLTNFRRPVSAGSTLHEQTSGHEEHLARQSCKGMEQQHQLKASPQDTPFKPSRLVRNPEGAREIAKTPASSCKLRRQALFHNALKSPLGTSLEGRSNLGGNRCRTPGKNKMSCEAAATPLSAGKSADCIKHDLDASSLCLSSRRASPSPSSSSKDIKLDTSVGSTTPLKRKRTIETAEEADKVASKTDVARSEHQRPDSAISSSSMQKKAKKLAFTVPKDHSIRAEEGGGKRLERPQQEALGDFKALRAGEDQEQPERCQQQSQKDLQGQAADDGLLHDTAGFAATLCQRDGEACRPPMDEPHPPHASASYFLPSSIANCRSKTSPSPATMRPGAHDKHLEGLYHDAFLNKRLGDSWKAGRKWAITDINGIQMCKERCLQFDDQFQRVSRRVTLSYKHDIDSLKACLNENWQQLSTMREKINRQGILRGSLHV